jgi:hypothetical protein
MNHTDWEPLAKTHAGSRFKRLGSHRAGSDPLKWPPRIVTRDRRESPASKWRLGVAGVTLDESRIWKGCGGMWRVKRKLVG